LKTYGLNLMLFAGLTVWSAVNHPWLAPAFASLTLWRSLVFTAATDRVRAQNVMGTMIVGLAFSYFGIAYLAALFAGYPDSGAFWTVFGAAAVIFLPVLILARRFLIAKPPVQR